MHAALEGLQELLGEQRRNGRGESYFIMTTVATKAPNKGNQLFLSIIERLFSSRRSKNVLLWALFLYSLSRKAVPSQRALEVLSGRMVNRLTLDSQEYCFTLYVFYPTPDFSVVIAGCCIHTKCRSIAIPDL